MARDEYGMVSIFRSDRAVRTAVRRHTAKPALFRTYSVVRMVLRTVGYGNAQIAYWSGLNLF